MPVPLLSMRLNWIVPVKPLMPTTLPLMSLASDRSAPPITPLPLTPTWLSLICWFWIWPDSCTPVVLLLMTFTPEPGAKPKPPSALSTVATTPVVLFWIRLPVSAAAAR